MVRGAAADVSHDLHHAQAAVTRAWTVTGLLRAAFITLAWVTASTQTWMLVTMVTLGLAAGAVATCGGATQPIRRWSWPVMTSLIVGWIAQMDWVGLLLGGMLVPYFFYVLNNYAKLIAEQSAQLIRSSLELERERDLVNAANESIRIVVDQLRAERDRVTQADSAKTRFLASASHDLRQPLYALSLNASTLGDVAARLQDPQLFRVEQGIKRALVQCRSLLDQLLDISKLESGVVDVTWGRVDVGQLLTSMQPPFAALAKEKGLRWRLDVRGAPCMARSDPALLERLLGNLLDNAIKFTKIGEVAVIVGRSEQGLTVDVSDTGPGIASSDQERIFEAFYQVGNVGRDRNRGLGLGLSIVKRLALLLQAEVTLHSELGVGSRFVVRLPGSEQNLSPDAAPTVPVAVPWGDRRRVLLVDDEAMLLEDLRLLLEGKGWIVDTASSVEEARRAAALATPDVMVADHHLADGETGLDAIGAVQAIVGRVPAIVVTGATDPVSMVREAKAGFAVYHKPLDGDVLARAMADAIATPGRSEQAGRLGLLAEQDRSKDLHNEK